jgi:hypothetical protein
MISLGMTFILSPPRTSVALTVLQGITHIFKQVGVILDQILRAKIAAGFFVA